MVGAAAGAWLLAGRGLRPALRDIAASLPPWRPWPALTAHLAAFAVTVLLAWRLLREGAPPPTSGALAGFLAFTAVTALLAMASAAPLPWLLRFAVVRWRFPIVAVALGLLSWRAAASAESLWGALSSATLRCVAWVLRLVASDVVVDPAVNLVGVRGFEVEIAPICSGVDGLGLVVLFQAVWISLARSRLRFPRALLLLPLGAAAALAANVLRTAILILVGASGRRDLAMGAFHSKLGWFLFIAIALGSVAIAERSPWMRRPDASEAARNEGVPPAAAAYLAPLLGALAAALVASAWRTGALDTGYGARIGAALAILFLVRKSLPRPSLDWSWVPVLLGTAACALWVLLAGGDGRALADDLARMAPAARWTWIATRTAGSILVIPLAEELAFRGFLLPWLVSPDFENVPPRAWSPAAVLVSSLAFGALHDEWLLGTAAGVAFAAARLYRGRLGDAILAHALCNAGVAAAVLLGGRWHLWG